MNRGLKQPKRSICLLKMNLRRQPIVNCFDIGKTPWSSGKVRVKTHVQEVVNSNPGPAVETIYHALLIWIKSMKAKIVEK